MDWMSDDKQDRLETESFWTEDPRERELAMKVAKVVMIAMVAAFVIVLFFGALRLGLWIWTL